MDKINQELKESSLRDDSLSSLVEQMQTDIMESLEKDRKAKLTESAAQPTLVWLLGGIIIGCIGSVVMIGYIRKS